MGQTREQTDAPIPGTDARTSDFPHIMWGPRRLTALATDPYSPRELVKLLETNGYNITRADKALSFGYAFRLEGWQHCIELYVVTLNMTPLPYEVAYYDAKTRAWVRYCWADKKCWADYTDALTVARHCQQNLPSGQRENVQVRPSLGSE